MLLKVLCLLPVLANFSMCVHAEEWKQDNKDVDASGGSADFVRSDFNVPTQSATEGVNSLGNSENSENTNDSENPLH